MEIISNPTQVEIKKAAQALKEGQLVAFPTETVYGLGADATHEKAVSRVYSVKARPTDHPLIVHFSSINQLDKWAIDIPEYARKLAKEFWPGPMTLILKRSEIAKDYITGSQDNIGVRVPAHPVALALLSEFEKLGGSGIAAPSANRFGAVSATTAEDVKEELGKFLNSNDLILDGGASLVGVESTIIDSRRNYPSILRPGAITVEMIETTTGYTIPTKPLIKNIRAPGLRRHHYSPKAEVVLDTRPEPGDGFIALADVPTPTGVIRLASPVSLEEYARFLYPAFRTGDRFKIKKIVAIQPAGEGIAHAIRDRLARASSS